MKNGRKEYNTEYILTYFIGMHFVNAEEQRRNSLRSILAGYSLKRSSLLGEMKKLLIAMLMFIDSVLTFEDF